MFANFFPFELSLKEVHKGALMASEVGDCVYLIFNEIATDEIYVGHYAVSGVSYFTKVIDGVCLAPIVILIMFDTF